MRSNSSTPVKLPRRARRLTAVAAATAAAALVCASAVAVPQGSHDGNGRPGTPGVGDPYFPLDGNGGYDVARYDLRLHYDPGKDVLRGVATIAARATQDLSRFNLDLVGLRVHSLRVDGEPARWSRNAHELRIDPRKSLRRGERFSVRVVYSGVPQPVNEPALGQSGFFATDDGFIVAGQPHGAAGWFPVNDHPSDRAAYTFRVTVPRHLEVVANGHLVDRDRRGRWTTWTWNAPDPMASYLVTVDVGRLRPERLPGGRHPLSRCRRPGPQRARRPDDGQALRHLPGRRLRVQAPLADGDCSRGGRHLELRREPAHRAGLGLLPRRGAPRRRQSLDDPRRRERAHQPGHGERLRWPREPAPLPGRALPGRRPGRRHLRHDRPDRGVERRERHRASAPRSGRSTCRSSPDRPSGCP